MSKTWKTRPYRVKVADHHHTAVAYHDHREGICDLPDSPADQIKITNTRWQHCYWDFSSQEQSAPLHSCEYCSMSRRSAGYVKTSKTKKVLVRNELKDYE